MKQAIDRGLTRNPDVTLAKLDELRATQGIRLTEDPFFPHIYMGSGLAYNNGMPLSIEGSAPSVIQAERNGGIFLTRPQHYAVEQQRESAKGATFATQQKRDEIVYRIADLFLDADRANRMIETARKQIDSFQKVLDTVQARVEEGRELPIEARQASVNIARARVRLSNLESDRDMAEHNLAIALGYTAGDLVAPSAAESHCPPGLPQDEATAVQTALAGSPEIKRLESSLIAKEGLRLRARKPAACRRSILVAQYALFASSNNLQQYFAKFQRNNGEVGASIQVPLFAGTGIKAAIAQMDAAIGSICALRLQSTRDRITMAVHQRYQGMNRAKLAADLAKEDLDLARDRLTLVLGSDERWPRDSA